MKEIIGSKTAIKLLMALFNNPLQEFKEIELIAMAKTGKGAASSAINKFVKEGFIASKRVGKTKILKLNLNNEAVLLLKSSFDSEKLQKLPKDVAASIILLRDNIREDISLMVAFGSYIAGTASSESDIDILIVTKNQKKASEEARIIEERFGKKINLHLSGKEELISQKENFIKNALLKGIIIYGYDIVFEILRKPQKEPLDKIEYLLNRHRAAERNYAQKDYEGAKYILENIMEQLVFLILSKNNISYASKKDAMDAIKQLPEGRIIENIKKMSGKQKIEQLEKFLIRLYTGYILGGYHV